MSANPAQLQSMLRYMLADLRARNGHHEFEHLARHVTKARFYANILPATGPVSAGGDQGRDFESFHTDIDDPTTRFGQATSKGRKIVGACTLQQDEVPGKIRGDAQSILNGGHVDEVLYFCEANVPVAARHKLEAWALEQGFTLQIVDGQAIADLLSDRDIFWIAQEYLKVPADLTPPAEDDDGYLTLRRRWDGRTPVPFSYAEFLEIKSGLRHATFEESARPDLPAWFGRMEAFLADPTPRDLQRSSLYELCVASLRGRGEMTSQQGRLIDYFSDIDQFLGLAELQDAAVLLVYADGARMKGEFDFPQSAIRAFALTLIALVDHELEIAVGPHRRSGLLRTRGQLALLPISNPDDGPTVAFGYWNQMLDAAQGAPFFPLEAFADYVIQLIEIIGDQTDLLALSDRLDDLIGARRGNAAAGEKAAERAQALLKHNRKLAALVELHKVKAKWYSGERPGGFVYVLILLSETYRLLGMAYAAKYYALAAAYMAKYEDRPEVTHQLPAALFEALDAEDAAGNSFGLISLFLVTLNAHVMMDDDPLNLAVHERLQINLGQLSALLGYLHRAQPELATALEKPLALWPPALLEPVEAMARDPNGFWTKGTWDEVWQGLNAAFIDRPFGDLGPTRTVSWSALGLDWTVRFANTYALTPLAEQFIAHLQIGACALAQAELGLLPTRVEIELAHGAADKISVQKLRSAGPPRLAVLLPPRDLVHTSVTEISSVLFTIFQLCSALPRLSFTDDVERGTRNLFSQIYVARPYAELYRDFVPQGLFFEAERLASPPFQAERPFAPSGVSELAWRNGLGPTYDADVALQSVENRYRRLVSAFGHTTAGIVRDPRTRTILQDMRGRGMKDWAILSIIANVAMNLRYNADKVDAAGARALAARFQAALDVPEQVEDALDPSQFTAEAFTAHEGAFLAAHMDGWQLAPRSGWDLPALERFMVERYRMKTDDLPHPNVFGWDIEAP